MRDTVYVEHKESIHYRNPSGVRAICSDCHVPKDWTAKLIRKIKATNELYHKLLGTIDTKEKFEQHRLEMAEPVWAEMTKTISLNAVTAMIMEQWILAIRGIVRARRWSQLWKRA